MLISERSRWRRIRDAAFTVVSLTQREDKLWYFPASSFDRFPYAPPDSHQKTIIESFQFGAPSISVTWKALSAQAAVLKTRPPAADEVILALEALREPRSGAYGSQSAKFGGLPSINESPRHTGMAMLIQLSFSRGRTAPELLSKLIAPARWLIDQDVMLPDGGWAFEFKGRDGGFGPMSSAAALVALCRFVNLIDSSDAAMETLKRRLAEAIGLGFERLMSTRVGSLWVMENEGGSQQNQVADSAFIVSLLRQAVDHDGLDGFVPGARGNVLALQAGLASLASEEGWPANAADPVSRISPTVCCLSALSSIRPDELTARHKLKLAESHALRELEDAYAWQSLRTWDWANIAEIASVQAGPMREQEARRLSRAIAEIREARHTGKLAAHLIAKLPRQSRQPVTYVLTDGGRSTLASGRFERWWNRRSAIFRNVVVPLWWVIIGVILKAGWDWWTRH